MKNKPLLLHVSVLVGLGVYLVLFYATRLPSLELVPGSVFRRAALFLYLLEPEYLVFPWFGKDAVAQQLGVPGQFYLWDRLPVLAVAGAILGSAFLLGWLVLSLFRADRGLTRAETFVFSTAVGLNLISTYVLVMGLLGLLGSVIVFALPAALALGAAGWLKWRREKTHGARQKESQSSRSSPPTSPTSESNAGGLSPRWLWLACPFVLVILLGAMLPPVEFDVREYHLQVPKEWFQQGRIDFVPHNVYGNMPMGTEMFSLLAMVIAGDWWMGAVAGKTVIAAFAPLTGLALLAAGRRLFSLTAGIVAAVVYISVPWITWISTNGLVEGAYGFYLLLAVYALVLWSERGDAALFSNKRAASAFLLVAGYLAGAAVACKYPALLFVVIPLTVWIIAAHRGPGWRAMWKPLGAFLLAVAVGCGLWLGKNWARAGNPTYPLLYSVFGGRSWTLQKDAQWNRVHRPHDFSLGALAGDLSRVGWRSERLSPLVVPLAVLAFFASRNRRLWLALALYFGFVIAAWWLLTHRLDRFWTPALPLVALLAGVGACWSRDRLWRGVLIGLLILGSASSFLTASSAGQAKYNRYFISLARAGHDPMRVDPWHRYFNDHLPNGGILIVGDAQVFDIEVPIAYSTCFDDSMFEQLLKDPATGQMRAPEEIRRSLGTCDVSHVYVHWGEINRYRSPGNYGFTDFVQPEVFESLVREGVLEPVRVPECEGHPGQTYRVVLRDGP